PCSAPLPYAVGPDQSTVAAESVAASECRDGARRSGSHKEGLHVMREATEVDGVSEGIRARWRTRRVGRVPKAARDVRLAEGEVG
ncbi:MAG: hypothetical protein ACRD2X_05230, partial [Vicinamibacteraceae bacterium]